MNMSKKMAWIVSHYPNKKTGSLELFKNTMKGYAWETAPLKTITEYGRYSVFHLALNRFLVFITAKDETTFTLGLTEL